MTQGSHRHDLIIGMTLAEVFLLAFLVGWLGTRDEVRIITISLADLRRQNVELAEKLAKAEAERDEQKKLYDELLKSLPGRDPRTGEWILFGEKPKCSVQDNVLIHASMRGGLGEVRLLQSFEKWMPGQILSGDLIPAFVRRVRGASDTVVIIKNQPGCRWQYVLDYSSDRDYRVGRQLFEDAFYVKQLNDLGRQP